MKPPNLIVVRALQLFEKTRKRWAAFNRKYLHRPITGKPLISIHSKGQKASDLIRDSLAQEKPLLIGRLGRLEMETMLRYQNNVSQRSSWYKLWRYLLHQSGPFWWDDDIRNKMETIAGFFPPYDRYLEKFAQIMFFDLPNADILGVFGDEGQLINQHRQIHPVPLKDLEPYFHSDPWTQVLSGKRVLVVHPFEKSILMQYSRRELLFKNPNVLPKFDLIPFKAVQSIAGTQVGFPNWFEALEWMCKQIETIKFDIAIIGAGAYGFPLAAFVKKIGKQAVHLGGATQLLFGIRGSRWDNRPDFQNLFNTYWIRPLPEETPENFQSVENGCYW